MTSTTACCGPKLGRETKVCAHLCFRLCRLILRCRNNMVDVSTTLARREYNPSTPSGGTSSRRTPRLPATQSRCAMIEYEPLPLHPALVPSGAPFAHACLLVMEGVSQPRFRWRRRGLARVRRLLVRHAPSRALCPGEPGARLAGGAVRLGRDWFERCRQLGDARRRRVRERSGR